MSEGIPRLLFLRCRLLCVGLPWFLLYVSLRLRRNQALERSLVLVAGQDFSMGFGLNGFFGKCAYFLKSESLTLISAAIAIRESIHLQNSWHYSLVGTFAASGTIRAIVAVRMPIVTTPYLFGAAASPSVQTIVRAQYPAFLFC